LKYTLLLMCLAAYVFGTSARWSWLYISLLLWKKILNYFVFVEVRILVEKWNIYEAHIFTRSLVQKCYLETNSLCLNMLLCVKTFLHFQYFYWNLGNHLTFMLSTPISSIIFHNRGTNVNYVLDFYVPADVHFSHFKELKSTFFTSLHFALRVMY